MHGAIIKASLALAAMCTMLSPTEGEMLRQFYAYLILSQHFCLFALSCTAPTLTNRYSVLFCTKRPRRIPYYVKTT